MRRAAWTPRGYPRRPRAGDANLKYLKGLACACRSAFLDQAHIRTICTRVQFAAGPGNGPASSNNNLPDFVAALHGIIDVEAVARSRAEARLAPNGAEVDPHAREKLTRSVQGKRGQPKALRGLFSSLTSKYLTDRR